MAFSLTAGTAFAILLKHGNPSLGGIRMMAEEWALAASGFFSGLAAGFLGGLCTILRPMQAAMTGPEFRTFMERFLRYADNGLGKVFNYAWSGATTIASIVALVLLWDDPGSTSFVLTAIGLGVWVVGVLVVSNVWKTPTYKMILAGTPRRCRRTGRRHGSATSRSTGSNSRPPGRRSPSSWWP